MAKALGFYVDISSCLGCKACHIACKDKNDLKLGELWRQVEEVESGGYVERGSQVFPNVYAYWITMSCNHCEDPKCVPVCPTGASFKREEDGLVLVNSDRCIGCRLCEWSCPYDARQFDGKKMTKCTGCEDLLAKGENPVCVDSCPMRIIDFGPMDELEKKYPGSVKAVPGLPNADITKPNLLLKPHKDTILSFK